jgi:hypothetical protein
MIHKCIAFANEDGKQKALPVNNKATALWCDAVGRFDGMACFPDILLGNVIVIWGDEKFMRAMRDGDED